MNTRGYTIWLTGLSASGKSTLGSALHRRFISMNIKSYILDGDNLRLGLNNNLGFSSGDREENIRRVGEVCKLFADCGVISLASFISPYQKDREKVKQLHAQAGLSFVEIYVNTPLEVCEQRDPKGLYSKARQGVIPNFTGINDPYEEPLNPDLKINTSNITVEEGVQTIIKLLEEIGLLQTHFSIVELFIPGYCKDFYLEKAKALPKLTLNKLDMEWVQVLAEGWASPLTGFMTEEEYLSTIHFGYIEKNGRKSNQTIPIVLSVDSNTKDFLQNESEITLVYNDKYVAILSNPEFFEHRKEERCSRVWGVDNIIHPYIDIIHSQGDWLLGGNIEVIEKIEWNDGLDKYRLSPLELRRVFYQRKADAIYAFQLRNPIHNGHALLMNQTDYNLRKDGYKNPLLLLHPLGGWTKNDDVPLDVRMEQYQTSIDEGVLNRENTILAIFPSPMLYAGPTEVQWHCKTRQIAGATHYIVGRDPAGISLNGKDLYNTWHGQKILNISPYLDIKIISFQVAAYDKLYKKMNFVDESRIEDFEFVSGTKMRLMARQNETPSNEFMNNKAWNVLKEYYNS
jgi:3'-phosphoadenosine 5'-phosphosulfate synthase